MIPRLFLTVLALLASSCRAAEGLPQQAAAAGAEGVYVAMRPSDVQRPVAADAFRASLADGVYLRLAWRQIEPAPGRFDWSVLDSELAAATAANKKLSLSVIAGGYTPAWLGSLARTSSFTVGKGGANRRCVQVTVGHPWDPAYQRRYLSVMTAVRDHLKAVPRAYDALRIVKIAAISQNTEELRLPSTDGKRSWRGRADPCDESDAIATWKSAGYTPEKLVAGWSAIASQIGATFPDKLIAQDVLERNGLPEFPGAASALDPQAAILAAGLKLLGPRFAVQWNGLTASGRLSEFVVDAHRRGAVIGWQTNAFRGNAGAGCNPDRLAAAQPCAAPGYAAILQRGIATGATYIEVWPADVAAFPAAIDAAEHAIEARGPARAAASASSAPSALAITPASTTAVCTPGIGRAAAPIIYAGRQQRFAGLLQTQQRLLGSERFATIGLGDSIMQRWPADDLARMFGGPAMSAGVGGDTVGQTLWRLTHQDWHGQRPKTVVLMIGTNDLARGTGACDLAAGIEAIRAQVTRVFPGARLTIVSVLPRGPALAEFADRIAQANASLKARAPAEGFTFLDANPIFANACAPARTTGRCDFLQGPKNVHPTPEGYAMLARATGH